MDKKVEYTVNLNFESITIPPFKDILILGTKSPHGRLGVEKGYQLLSIELFTVINLEDEIVAHIFINNNLLKKMPQEEILNILKENVFPYMSSIETIKVDFDLEISVKNIKGTLK